MSAVKKAVIAVVITAVGLTTLVMGAAALVYECALNANVCGFFVDLFDRINKAKEEPVTEEVSPEDDDGPSEPDWFTAHMGDDQVITADATGRIHAYIIPAEEPSHKWAILCHGYNSGPDSVSDFAEHYYQQGYSCICPSLRGWGNDETKYCSMGYHDKDLVLAWIDYIVNMDPEAEILLHGYSMGAVTVMLVTGEELPSQVRAAVSDCGFTSCWEQYARVMKSLAKLPPFPLLYAINAVSILRGNFDIRDNVPIDAVSRSVTPTIFLHGTADNFVPFEMMDRLYEACSAPKAKQAIEGADHAASVSTDPDTYWKAVDGFLKDKIK